MIIYEPLLVFYNQIVLMIKNAMNSHTAAIGIA